MRLINVHSLELKNFFGKDVPKYAILSHRWRADETSYEDYVQSPRAQGLGVNKIYDFCASVKGISNEALHYAWIDTACIDKRSSAELSEAINSMAKWYRNSAVCVVHLYDVRSHFDSSGARDLGWESMVRKSEWFRRGWTLQELLFPKQVVFCDARWREITQLKRSEGLVSEITGIRDIPWRGADEDWLRKQSVAMRMSWAAGRRVTRPEDKAYCLLGLFDINMPLLYGEGERAFLRLQEEIIERPHDESLFVHEDEDQWGNVTEVSFQNPVRHLLAPSPNGFRGCGCIESRVMEDRPPTRRTNRALEIQARAVKIYGAISEYRVLQLNCHNVTYNKWGKQLHPYFLVIKRPMNSKSWSAVGVCDIREHSGTPRIIPFPNNPTLIPMETYHIPLRLEHCVWPEHQLSRSRRSSRVGSDDVLLPPLNTLYNALCRKFTNSHDPSTTQRAQPSAESERVNEPLRE